MPSEEGEIVGKLYDKSVGTFLEEDNGWYKIQSGKCTGYVKAEYCVTGEEANELAREVGRRVATVTTETLYVRQEPTTESAILGMVPLEEVLTVTEELDGWVQVKIEEGEGYVSADYVTLSTEFVEAESKEEEEARLKKEEEERQQALEASRKAKAAKEAEEAAAAAAQAAASQETTSQETTTTTTTATVSADTSSLGQQVANYGLQFVGNPYVYGGTSLTNGADCSGFTLSVYANFGVSLPHSASAQRKKGYDVGGIANAIPGDLVFYSGHVGIYIGNGQIVHASNSRTGIIVSSAYYDTIIDVRRIF
jgi:cell wall-associated NlpC family hydrolase